MSSTENGDIKTKNDSEKPKEQFTSHELGKDHVEAPKYSCALGGAYGTALGVYGLVPLLHAGLGCGLGQLFGQLYAGGQNAGGPVGGTSTATTGLVEEHVIFGGEDKLRKLINASSEVYKDDKFVVISGCIPALIGDDVEAVIREYEDKLPIFHINAPGFNGNSYEGYELFFEALIDQILTPLPIEKGVVNILGVVPYQHIFWKGELLSIKKLLESIGLKANIIFTEPNGFEKLKELPAAEYNIVLSTWNGHRTAEKLQKKFGTPFISFPSVPLGPKQTSHFLRTVGEKLEVPSEKVEKFIEEEERRAYRFIEYTGDALLIVRPHSYFAVVADSNKAIAINKFLVNEMGYLPDIIQLTDNPPEEYRESIIEALTEDLISTTKPEVVFEPDAYLAREKLRDRPFQFLFASSLEANSSLPELGALHVTVAFPSFNRVVLGDSYAGYDGGLRLLEDYISTFAGPL
ncbi:MAG: nitrogenase component 1 [Methanobacteriaceae archaeon]|nr:nitrogenase component 1 [Methanobacteriaceae archaeon]MDP2835998.1 nitrogenase component 1 [Methanobacteriaceae archaeon]MDP3035772.1 nitrogenase component 1 [Methanobacteriaceae archaeon]MDP3484069.1 nitrogenase component 1 [Methanobacteriaceae archaeon]MDP3622822.1 nitrogenase component 1 [Methanobacteriaceae archaeon]